MKGKRTVTIPQKLFCLSRQMKSGEKNGLPFSAQGTECTWAHSKAELFLCYITTGWQRAEICMTISATRTE